jgi:hypothetical protein
VIGPVTLVVFCDWSQVQIAEAGAFGPLVKLLGEGTQKVGFL